MKKRIARIIIWTVVIAGLLLTMHILVNNFHIFEVLKKLHGG
ncbi:MAG: hypothetical protein Q7T89_11790 [Anaerolineales bacterium]|nr:hypothetical protein [Anaerolineales bacterium]